MVTNKPASSNSYRVSKKLFWSILFGIVAILTVLLVLTIYFGVNQKHRNDVDNESRTTLTSTLRPSETTTTVAPRPPVARIPDDLQQQFYQLKIEPDLADETFKGQYLP
jgi:heme/copper-type cytochrome/quinol oxidase subunit 2